MNILDKKNIATYTMNRPRAPFNEIPACRRTLNLLMCAKKELISPPKQKNKKKHLSKKRGGGEGAVDFGRV